MKTCSRCGVAKESSLFQPRARSKDGLQAWCKVCNVEVQRQWSKENNSHRNARARERYAANPGRAAEAQRRYHEKHREKVARKRRAQTLRYYGLTPESYDAMLDQQGGACALCRSADPQHWSGKFHIDHDHSTGAVRGLLCAPCNGGLGLLGDTAERLQAAVEYIRSHSNRRAESA